MELNEDQRAAFNGLLKFAKGEDSNQMMLLEGYAGTGKTFTITAVVKTLLQFATTGFSICMSAPTHKAVKVLKKFSTMGDRVSFATIHSLLGLQENVNEATGKITFTRAFKNEEDPRIAEYDVVIIDEASMLQDELFTYLLEFQKRIKIIFVGDGVQIPPVGKTDSIPFNPIMREKYKIGHLRLQQIVRQAADNPILGYATEIRKVYKSGTVKAVAADNAGKGIDVFIGKNNEMEIKDWLSRMFCGNEFKENPDYAKVVAWRNVTVNDMNREIRKLIYKKDKLPNILEGDYLVMDKPVFEVDSRKKIILHTSDEVIVKSFTKQGDVVTFYRLDERLNAVPDNRFIYFYDTVCEYEEIDGTIRKYNLHIVHDDSVAQYNEILELNKKAALGCREKSKTGELWKSYYNVIKRFAQVKYNYAITSHKSQGSTYTYCMSFEWDIDTNSKLEERNRIKYVAATRPTDKLIIIK